MASDHDDQTQPLRITDRRRFANMGAEGAAADPAADAPGPAAAEPGTDGGTDPSLDRGAVEQEASEIADDLGSARAEAGQYLDHLRRLQAEFDNYRKRVAREQEQLAEFGAMPIARRLLEVLDDFELALMSADDKPDFDRFLKGVELVYAKLSDALKAEGLERMEAEGATFDPELHEALMQSGEGESEPVVIDVLRPGYTLKGRVLRPAGVRVERR